MPLSQSLCQKPMEYVQAQASVVMHQREQIREGRSIKPSNVDVTNSPVDPQEGGGAAGLPSQDQLPQVNDGDATRLDNFGRRGQQAAASRSVPADVPDVQIPDAQADQVPSVLSRAGQRTGGPCVQCGANRTPLFRKCRDGRPLCNACGLRYNRSLQRHQVEPAAAEQPLSADTEGGPHGDAALLPAAAKKARRGSAETPPKTTRRKLPPDECRRCRFCSITTSPQWRYCDKELACNACALRKQRREDRTTRDVQLPQCDCQESYASRLEMTVRTGVTGCGQYLQDGSQRKGERRKAEVLPVDLATAVQALERPPPQRAPPAASDTVAGLEGPPPQQQTASAAAPSPKAPRLAVTAGADLHQQPIRASSETLLACVSYFASSVSAASKPDTSAAAPGPAAGAPRVKEEVLATVPTSEDVRRHQHGTEAGSDGRQGAAAATHGGTRQGAAAVAAGVALLGAQTQHGEHDCAASRNQLANEQPPNSETVRGIVMLLQSGGLVTATEAQAYMVLWEQLDDFRQRAARSILVDALLWKHQPEGAVKHIRSVLSDNE